MWTLPYTECRVIIWRCFLSCSDLICIYVFTCLIMCVYIVVQCLYLKKTSKYHNCKYFYIFHISPILTFFLCEVLVWTKICYYPIFICFWSYLTECKELIVFAMLQIIVDLLQFKHNIYLLLTPVVSKNYLPT